MYDRPVDTTHALERESSPAMDAMLGHAFPVLDHGFIRPISYMGNDEAIVQAARVSYGTGTKAVQSDRGLIRYLMRRWHSTPFEMCEIKLHVKLPVFVARQWIRHRTANVNEVSARYSILDREFYIPEPENVCAQSSTNNQGRGEPYPANEAYMVRELLHRDATRAYDSYEAMIDSNGTLPGVAREIARMNLPTNIYTQWYWKVDLHNLFHFLRLRADPHAQLEIRAYAEAICQIVKAWVPLAYEAFEDYRLNAVTFSAQEMKILRSLISDTSLKELDLGDDTQGLSKREMRELFAKIVGSD